MATILITGVTGTVMNPISARLLEEGHVVLALVRPIKGDPKIRISKSLRTPKGVEDRLVVLAGDITQKFGGLTSKELRYWRGKIDKIVHGAASIKFEETEDNQVFNTNVCGTENMLHLADELDIPEFHHISTAYVCGDAEYFTEQDLGQVQRHRNVYEHSKAEAERLIRSRLFPGSYSIYRIPVVVGHSETGEINSFSGYYGFFAPFWQLAQTLQKKSESELRECGIYQDKEGYFHTPLYLPCTTIGPINLVPIDWLTDMLIRLLNIPADQRTFHLTHPSPRSVRETVEVSTAHLGLRGITCGMPPHDENGSSKFLSTIQRGIITKIKLFEPYTSKDRKRFDNAVAVHTLGENWREPPEITDSLMGRLLDFAKGKNFGR